MKKTIYCCVAFSLLVGHAFGQETVGYGHGRVAPPRTVQGLSGEELQRIFQGDRVTSGQNADVVFGGATFNPRDFRGLIESTGGSPDDLRVLLKTASGQRIETSIIHDLMGARNAATPGARQAFLAHYSSDVNSDGTAINFTVDSTPRRAIASVSLKGSKPFKIFHTLGSATNLDYGTYEIVVKMPNFEDATYEVNLYTDPTRIIRCELVPKTPDGIPTPCDPIK